MSLSLENILSLLKKNVSEMEREIKGPHKDDPNARPCGSSYWDEEVECECEGLCASAFHLSHFPDDSRVMAVLRMISTGDEADHRRMRRLIYEKLKEEFEQEETKKNIETKEEIAEKMISFMERRVAPKKKHTEELAKIKRESETNLNLYKESVKGIKSDLMALHTSKNSALQTKSKRDPKKRKIT
jgi:hypothetical protein